MNAVSIGYEEGELCGRDGCEGTIAIDPSENCSCHLHPPCGSCTDPSRTHCSACDWRDKYEAMNDFVVAVDRKTGVYKTWELRELDPTKIDYHTKAHTHFSMIKEGVYPPTMTRAEVEKEVKGTFGGRFNYFRDGKFCYVAYTD